MSYINNALSAPLARLATKAVEIALSKAPFLLAQQHVVAVGDQDKLRTTRLLSDCVCHCLDAPCYPASSNLRTVNSFGLQQPLAAICDQAKAMRSLAALVPKSRTRSSL